jgi:hypothetical protein
VEGTVIGGAESAGNLASHHRKPATSALTSRHGEEEKGARSINIEPQAPGWSHD